MSVCGVFPNTGKLLLSGGIGNVTIPHKEEEGIVIPHTATTELQDKILVYKVSESGHKEKTISPVELTVEKLNDGKLYIVRSGLSTGDVIVTEGAGLLRDGMKINIKEE